MPDLLRSTTPVARKVHRCATCGQPAVQPGQKYLRDTYAYDGRVYDWVQCAECAEIASEVYDASGEPDEGVGRDDYEAWADETRRDPHWGDRARALLSRLHTSSNPGGEDHA